MAKKQQADIVGIGIGDLPPKLRQGIAALKQRVLDLRTKFGAMRESMAEIAPRLQTLFDQGQAALGERKFKFITFVRCFDPSVPDHPRDDDRGAGYQTHKTFYTLQYMRRTYWTRKEGAAGEEPQAAGVRQSAADVLAAILASLITLPGVDAEEMYTAIKARGQYGDRALKSLRQRVERASKNPLFVFGKRDALHVVKSNTVPTPAEQLTQPGQSVDLDKVGKLTGKLRASMARSKGNQRHAIAKAG